MIKRAVVFWRPSYDKGGIPVDRFEKIYRQGIVDVTEIWVDRETGVNYIWHSCGNAGGLTPLLGEDGEPVVTKVR